MHSTCTGLRKTGRRPHRAGCAAAAFACFAFAAAYLAQAWRIIFTLRIGPVVAVIDEAHGHGIHSGDFIGVGCALVGLALLMAGMVLLDDSVGAAARLASVSAQLRPARLRPARLRPVRLRPAPRRQARPAFTVPVTHQHRTATARRRHRQAWSRPAVATV